MTEYFSATAKQTGRLVKYRSYKTGSFYDKVSERYNHVDIYELTTVHVPLDTQKLEYYREHTDKPIVTPTGADDHLIALSREPFYSARGDYVILPVALKVRRFRFASKSDLELWQEESKEENIVFVGAIAGDIPTREILEASGEDGLIHEVISDRDAIREAAASSTDYEEHFSLPGPCHRYDCSVCTGPIIHLDRPTWFILGLPQDHEKVITLRLGKRKEAKLKYMYKLARLMQISTMLSQVSDSVDAVDSPSLNDYYDDMS